MRESEAPSLLISVIVPCRNELEHIDAFCDSVLEQALPNGWQMEVLIADGESDDGTREKLLQRCAADSRFVLVANPGRIVSSGLNACIGKARGSVIARLDVHSRFASDYLAQCLAALGRTGADNVGGPWVAKGETPTGQAVAVAFQCRWVIGGALSRDASYEGEADTVYLGCWRAAVFEQHGLFDESLVRNQDDEHNLRLRRRGARIWQSHLIRSCYRPRDSLRHLFNQQRQYGYWRPFVMRKHGQPGSLRQIVPALFVAALVASIAISPWAPLPLAVLAVAYSAYLGMASLAAVRHTYRWTLLPHVALAIAAFHLGYGIGTWRGLWDMACRRKPSSDLVRITR